MADRSAQPLSRSTLFYYSLADLPVTMSIFPVAVFVPRFYASDVGVSLVTVGAIILGTRILDVLTDPLMGWISDHTRFRWGRRKPWIALATPVLMLAIYNLFLPPEDVGGLHLAIWLAVLGIGTTMMLIPYYAWGAELSSDYNERTRITGWRAMAGVSGSLAAQMIPGLALLLFAVGGSRVILEIVGWTMLLVTPVCVVLTLWKTPDPGIQIRSVIPVLPGLRLMFSNKPFLRLIAAFMIGSIGLNITTPLYIFYVADVLGAEAQSIYMLTCFYITNLLSIPFWVSLSARIEKHRAYVAAFALIAIAHPFYLLLGEGDFWWMLPITVVTGFAAGGFSQSMPNSMKADVIDLDTLRSGENRAALFFSAWSFAQKATASIGSSIAMFGLALWGFDAGPEAQNSSQDIFGLRFLFSTFPSLFFLTGALLVWNFPITRDEQAAIRRQLA